MTLLTILKKTKRKEKELRVLMLGLDNAGKTTVVKRINGTDITEISPTLGFNIETMEYNNFKINIWDVGGQETIRSYWRNYFEETDGLVWVIDSADVRRLGDCKAELKKVLVEEKLSGASLLILANKCDLRGALNPEQISKELGLDEMIVNRHYAIQQCSAVTGEGLAEGFDWLITDIASRVFLLG
eukprot:Rmarinus@m.10896